MKIRKYQVGSIIYTPTPTAAATASAQQSASSSSASKDTPEKITGTIQKEIMDLMKTDGLPSDVDALLTYASKYLDKSSRLSDMSLFGGTDSDYDIKDYIKILRQVQEAKFNNGEFKKASENLEKEGAWGNAAIDSTGNLFVQDEKGQLGKVTLRKYIDNRDKYHAVTNGELMEMRARQKGLAFDQIGILTNMQEADGMKSITDQLRKIMGDFKQKKVQYYKFSKGTDRITDKSGKTYSMQELDDGMEMLTKGGPSGYYKMTNATNVPSVKRAVMYLWNSLDDSMQNTIKAQIATSGDDPDNDGIINFLENIIWAGTNEEQSADFDSSATNYDPNGTGKKGGSADKKDELVQMNYLGQIAAGYYGPAQTVKLTGKTSKVAKAGMLETKGWDLGAIIGHDQKTLEKQTVSSLLSNAWGFQAANTGSITFGNKHITAEEAQALYWNGADHLNAVQLPVTTDDHGNIIPDLELNEKIQKLNEDAKGKSPTEINDYIKSYLPGIEVKKNAQGQYEAVNVPTMTFLTTVVTASDDVLDLTDENKLMLDKVDDPNGLLRDIYNRIVRYGTLSPHKDTVSLGFDKAGKRSFYKGNVYIPIDNPYSGFRVSGLDPYVTKGTLDNPAEKATLRQAVVQRAQQGNDLVTNFNE